MDQKEMYAKMYSLLVVAAAGAVDELDRNRPLHARKLLTDALNEAEDFYLDHWEGSLGRLSQEDKDTLRELVGMLAEEFESDNESL